jgi:membrane-bound lytic murein transglycosylase B
MKILATLVAGLFLSACASTPHAAATRGPAPVVARNAPDPSPVKTSDPEAAATPATAPPRVKTRSATNATPIPGSLASRADVQVFIQNMVTRHDFDANDLNAVFSQARARPDIIALITRPAEAKPWHAYRKIFLTPQRIAEGATFWRDHAAALARAEQVYGVPARIIVAIIGVETLYGGNTGSNQVLEALSTLAFDYPKRADFFRKELESYLILTRQEGIDPLSLQGSYAGAMGLGQFMPSSYLSYAVDFDDDGHRDLWRNPADAIGSVANYLREHRWQPDRPIASPARVQGNQFGAFISEQLQPPQYPVGQLRQHGITPLEAASDQELAMLLELAGEAGPEYWLGYANFYAITRYNHSALYAMAVYQLSEQIRERFESRN